MISLQCLVFLFGLVGAEASKKEVLRSNLISKPSGSILSLLTDDKKKDTKKVKLADESAISKTSEDSALNEKTQNGEQTSKDDNKKKSSKLSATKGEPDVKEKDKKNKSKLSADKEKEGKKDKNTKSSLVADNEKDKKKKADKKNAAAEPGVKETEEKDKKNKSKLSADKEKEDKKKADKKNAAAEPGVKKTGEEDKKNKNESNLVADKKKEAQKDDANKKQKSKLADTEAGKEPKATKPGDDKDKKGGKDKKSELLITSNDLLSSVHISRLDENPKLKNDLAAKDGADTISALSSLSKLAANTIGNLNSERNSDLHEHGV